MLVRFPNSLFTRLAYIYIYILPTRQLLEYRDSDMLIYVWGWF